MDGLVETSRKPKPRAPAGHYPNGQTAATSVGRTAKAAHGWIAEVIHAARLAPAAAENQGAGVSPTQARPT